MSKGMSKIFIYFLVLGIAFVNLSSFAYAQATDTPPITPTVDPTPTDTPSPTPTLAPGTTTTPTPTCGTVSAPTGLSAVSSGPTQITLTWTAASGSPDYYILSYGTASGNYAYGNPQIEATTTYVVSSLTKGTKYYFALKAHNGCSTSDYSTEVSATAGDTPSGTPSPSPAPSQPPEEQAQPQQYQAADAQQQTAPQQAVQGAQGQQGQFVTIPTYTPTPTDSPIGSTVNIISFTGAAVVIFIVGISLVFWYQSQQSEKQHIRGPNEKTEF